MFCWDEYWKQLIEDNNLNAVINKLNEQDEKNGFEAEHTKNICKEIYEDFESHSKEFLGVKHEFLSIIEKLQNVHSFSSRLKATDSLILKVIRKRNSSYAKSNYRNISVSNYKDTLGDIIGMRIILHYQGQWRAIHDEIINLFPEKYEYPKQGLVNHVKDEQFMAEAPKAYYDNGDDISQFENIIQAVPHDKGYRSFHYVISFKNVYIELQMRTIYDEAWSDCDHNYVYKNEANPNNLALSKLTKVLSKLTNCSSDISELMRMIFLGNYLSCKDNKIAIDTEGVQKFEKILNDLDETKKALIEFYCSTEKQ